MSIPGGGHDNPLQHSCLENPQGQGSLTGYRQWGCKELDTTERLSIPQHSIMSIKFLLNLSPPKISQVSLTYGINIQVEP